MPADFVLVFVVLGVTPSGKLKLRLNCMKTLPLWSYLSKDGGTMVLRMLELQHVMYKYL